MDGRVGGDTLFAAFSVRSGGWRNRDGAAFETVRRRRAGNMTRRRLSAMLLAVAVTAAAPINPTRAQSAAHLSLISTGSIPRVRGPCRRACIGLRVSRRSSRVPLIVFSHGIGGSRRGYSYLGRYWAARGIASLHVQHAGSNSSLWVGNPLGVVGRLQRAAHESEALARAWDMRSALDRVLSSPYGAEIDRRRIVAAGHSYGANTALLAVGGRVMREGRWIEAGDPRIAAAIVISAPPFYGESDSRLGTGQDRSTEPARDCDQRRHRNSRIPLGRCRSVGRLQRRCHTAQAACRV